MERFFIFSLFLYILSALSALGSNRNESRYSVVISQSSYWLALAGTALVYVLRPRAGGSLIPFDFFDGSLIAILVGGGLYGISLLRVRLPYGAAAMSVLALLIGVFGLLKASVTDPARTVDHLLGAHIVSMFLCLAFLSLSFLFAVLYLLQEHFLKSHQFGTLAQALPPLELAGRLNFFSVIIGSSALLAGIVSGFIHHAHLGMSWSEDPALLLAIVMMAVYAVLILIRIGPLDRAKVAARISLISYILLVFVFAGAHW